MKVRVIILFLFFSGNLLLAQDKREQYIRFQSGFTFTQPSFSASPNYQIGISDSVVREVKDSLRRYRGFNYEASYLINVSKNFYLRLGLCSNFYGMSERYVRVVSVQNIDSTYYLNIIKLRTIEIPVGIEYNIKIRRSFLFVGIALSGGLIPVHNKIQKSYDWYTGNEKGETRTKIECDKFYLAGTFNIGFSQYLTPRLKLCLSYQQHQQLNSLKLISDYYRLRFSCKSFNLGITINI